MEIPKKKWEALVARVERLEKKQKKTDIKVAELDSILFEEAGGAEGLNELLFEPVEGIDDEDE